MTKTTLQRLLSYPHAAVFDTGADGRMVFRLRHADGARWRIADETLTAWAGEDEFVFDLRQHTVHELILALEVAGFEMLPQNPDYFGVSARVLAESRGDQYESNGDHVEAFNSVLWGLMSGYAVELRGAEYQVGQALRQMVIPQASGEWLDVWAGLYGVPRLPGEGDASLRIRIPSEAFRRRVNAHGIELAIREETGFDVEIREPWKDIFTLDQSTLSGPDKTYDGARVGYHLIQPVIHGFVDYPAVIDVINENRPAGVEVLQPQLTYLSGVDGSGATIEACINSSLLRLYRVDDIATLDGGPMEDVSVLNYESIHLRGRVYVSGSEVMSQPWGAFPWPPTSWADTIYIVSNIYGRDYREYLFLVENISQFWDESNSTWSDLSLETWAGLNPLIWSGHGRES